MESYRDLSTRLKKEEESPNFDRKTISPLKLMVKWLENSICNTQPKQNVVQGGRIVEGVGAVTEGMFAQKHRSAHVCPFVRDSLDSNLFWFEESPLDRNDEPLIERRLTEMVDEFLNMSPAYDPKSNMSPAFPPMVLKAFLVVFPNLKVRGRRGVPDVVMDSVHTRVKPQYIASGLMLGQFYPSCPFPGIYNKAWPALTSPLPAFAVRYMVRHDTPFIPEPLIGLYKQFFPDPN